MDFQHKLQDQSRSMFGAGDNQQVQNELWAQFLNFQGPAMQNMMGTYVEQSQKMFQQMQDKMQEQTRMMFPGLYPGHEGAEKGPDKGDKK